LNRVTFNLRDVSFAHTVGMVPDKKSRYIDWDRTCADPTRPTFYTNEEIFRCDTPRELSYGVLYESKAILGGVFRKTPRVMHRFRHIFTHDARLLRSNPEIFKLIPGGGVWIGAAYGGGTIGIKPKSKLVSMVSSTKHSARLHRFRLRLAKRLAAAELVDVYGLDRWTHINETLDDYMFSIVIENSVSENYFTEKLLNCCAVGTVPIYLGCPNVGSFFDDGGIIRVGRWTNFKRLIRQLTPDAYKRRLSSISRNYTLCQQYEILDDFIYEKYFLGRVWERP
jgi:hypothetical protein